jgi:hypothetical protein
MRVRRVFIVVSVFVFAAVAYAVTIVSCMAFDESSPYAAACSAIGGMLRFPTLYFLPYWNSRIAGIDAAVLAVVLNATFWGIVAVLVVAMFTRKSKLKDPGSH